MAKEPKKQLLSREQLRSLIKEENLKTPEDVHRLLKDMFGGVLQEMLEAEMDQNLGFEKTTPGLWNKQTAETATAKRLSVANWRRGPRHPQRSGKRVRPSCR